MSVTSQDVIAFKLKFASFMSTDDSDIAEKMNFADLWIDRTQWSLVDYPWARQLLTAHLLQLDAQAVDPLADEEESSSGGGAGPSDLFIKQVRIGERMVGFAQRGAFANAGQSGQAAVSEQLLSLTNYGLMYMQLRDRNIIPVMIV